MEHVLPILSLILGTVVASAAYGEESKTARIAFLLMGKSQAGLTSAFDEFREGLRELGWLEKQNIVIEYRWAGENPDRLPELAAELVRLKVDAIIGSTAGVRAAQQATTSIPIIMCIADDAVKQGFVTNLARPGGNITGMAADALELAKKTHRDSARDRAQTFPNCTFVEPAGLCSRLSERHADGRSLFRRDGSGRGGPNGG